MNNTVKRTISGVLFVAMMLAGLLINQFLYAVLVVFMMVTMLMEFYRITMGDSFKVSRALAVCAGLFAFGILFAVTACHLPPKFAGLNVVPFLAVMISTLYAKDKSEFGKVSNLFAGLMYICLPLALSNLIVFNKEGKFSGLLMLCFFIIIWASDVGAYCFGMLFGQKGGKKLFPSISPQKSWAGFWGGFACAVLSGGILWQVRLLPFPLVHSLILAMVMNIAGVYGDLFESQWKRHYHVKDSGRIIPGHGGMLDRFDSAIFAIPAGTVYLILTGLL